ncbi:hypothetical protein CVT24_010078 [Panaeolus cyanescens]|uniref:Uncharacterized protein n=1 Tax=Panaeolus cyanescens TaxID=181874 RepID=A0A409YQ20_9AGAR|nr:hypothetical protein CVT24_010078 [Panaeolus cyanescens]
MSALNKLWGLRKEKDVVNNINIWQMRQFGFYISIIYRSVYLEGNRLAAATPAATARDAVGTAKVAVEAASDDDTVGEVEAETTAGTNDTTDAVASTKLADVPVVDAGRAPEAGDALAEGAGEDVAAAADGEPEAEAGSLGVDIFLLEDLKGDVDGVGTDEGLELLHLFLGGVGHVDLGDLLKRGGFLLWMC